MYGYNVTAVTVERVDGQGGAQQVDNFDGQGADLHKSWREYFNTQPSEHIVKTRRYWRTPTKPKSWPNPGVDVVWSTVELEYGASGIPGKVIDTGTGVKQGDLRPVDAAVHGYRHLIARPKGGTALLVAAEVIGRSRAASGALAAFQKHFETSTTGLRLQLQSVLDGEYWEEFLDNAGVVSATVRRQAAAPSYLSPTNDGASAVAIWETNIKPAARGQRWASTVVRNLLDGAVSPADAFGLDFEPDRTSVELESQDGQRRRVIIETGEPPTFVYPIGDLDRPDQPKTADFRSAAAETLQRLLPVYT